ncbi:MULTISPECIES: SDR family NAD(P)-dependent oxidoreductase [unclassified Nocardioides]|uniref:SDR family NAD(P)-dependent oxidoreductase n=1 Tax=unclassified Nocardioides TaxID=2615069 RepID=UPI0006F9974B|nr:MULTISPECIES: SDR family oxidoreductase [unclassified Nocardioides]KRA39189.1 oxidoreductase [Nocardioides sp. Root614]KRA93148.1 oxidoreductase [Nocardioides sp. Root682]
MNQLELAGRKALVTGGAQGLGRKFAEFLSAAGATVVVADLQDEKGKEVAESIGGSFVHLDVTDDASWEAGIAQAVSQAGGLDVLVNNAGIEIAGLFIDLDPDVVRRIFDVNVVGTSLGIKHAFRAMGPGGAAGHVDGGGVVINIASVAATIAFPALSAYSASKSAVDRLTRVAAMESGKLGLGVRVNCICPGLVPNEMGAGLANEMTSLGLFPSPEEAVAGVVALTPSGRLATEEEIADAVVFLASDRSKFINGVGLSVDGGMGM